MGSCAGHRDDPRQAREPLLALRALQGEEGLRNDLLLFLDDSPDRAKVFLDKYPGAKWVTTAADCITALRSQPWHTIFLDHDLGGQSMVDSNREDCGMEVVRWMVLNRPIVKQVIIHSWNTPAARRMIEDLRRREYNARYSPFGEDEWSKP